ncbi:MAG: lysylphosphatidylglycerol synthase transmembrane domain-containing protein [Desulfocapsaceae bacterium]|nr:lysylphosphatidylglycerol synthase transmembrane domain-containing protein [Desulfocapsaceae bacterium]
MTAKKIVRLALSLSLAILFVWLIARQINLDEFRKAFIGTTTLWVIASLAAFSVGYSCRIERWHLMLQCDNSSLKWVHCFGPFFAGFAANNVLPFRAGDALRVFAFNGRLGVSSGIVLATLFVERLLDLLMVLVLLGVVLTLSGLDINGFTGIGNAALIAISLGILFFLLFPQLFAPVVIIAGKLIARIAPKFGERLLDEINKSLVTLAHLAKGRIMIRLVAWSAAVWLAEGCVFWFAALALSSIASPAAGWLALPVGTLATLIPSTPGYVGTFDYFTVRAMSALGNSVVASTAYALLVHALLWLPPTLIGGLYLLLHPSKKINELKNL